MITLGYKDIGTGQPVSLSQMKAYLGQTGDHHDAMITDMIMAARERAELYMNRSVSDKEITLFADRSDWPRNRVIKLPRGPIKEIVEVKVKNPEGTWETITDYKASIISDPGILVIPTLSTADIADGLQVIHVTYKTGWGDRTIDGVQYKNPLPELIRVAIMMMVRTMYDQRDEFVRGTVIARLPQSSEHILEGFRIAEFL